MDASACLDATIDGSRDLDSTMGPLNVSQDLPGATRSHFWSLPGDVLRPGKAQPRTPPKCNGVSWT